MARTRRTPKKDADWEAFLDAFRATGTVTGACKATGLSRSTVYDHRAADDAFAAAWADIEEEVTEQLEQEAKRRALEGVEKPVFHQGEECGAVRQYSDTLLIFLLKARRPGVYRENMRVEHTGAAGGAIELGFDAESRRLVNELLARSADARAE